MVGGVTVGSSGLDGVSVGGIGGVTGRIGSGAVGTESAIVSMCADGVGITGFEPDIPTGGVVPAAAFLAFEAFIIGYMPKVIMASRSVVNGLGFFMLILF